jgi:hypothetical protein
MSGKQGDIYEGLGQMIGLEVAKRAVEFSIGLLKMSDRTLWRSRTPPKQKKRLLAAWVPAGIVGALDTPGYFHRVNGSNCDTPISYSVRTALRKEQCEMSAESQNCEASRDSRC